MTTVTLTLKIPDALGKLFTVNEFAAKIEKMLPGVKVKSIGL